MLREITINELFRSGEPIYFLNTITGTLVPAEDLFQGIRILRDETVVRADITKEEPKKKTKVDLTTDTGKRRTQKGSAKDIVLKAWRASGCTKTASEIAKETGLHYTTVRNYIPTSKEG